MKKIITLYHGSDKEISVPSLCAGKRNNDYGQGFYCTEHYDLACEWASKRKGQNGFVNQYELNLSELRVLNLTKKEFSILNWITILLQNRTFTLTSPISVQAKEYLTENFNIDLSDYDIVIGYRADDSYFSFAEDFLNNAISTQHLGKAMRLGKLGIQVVLISDRAFEQLKFVRADQIDNHTYYPLYANRDMEARKKYKDSKENALFTKEELFILDILRGGIKNGDSRIP